MLLSCINLDADPDGQSVTSDSTDARKNVAISFLGQKLFRLPLFPMFQCVLTMMTHRRFIDFFSFLVKTSFSSIKVSYLGVFEVVECVELVIIWLWWCLESKNRHFVDCRSILARHKFSNLRLSKSNSLTLITPKIMVVHLSEFSAAAPLKFWKNLI